MNHSAKFAPVLTPTLSVGVDSYAVAALSWLMKKQNAHDHEVPVEQRP